MGETTKKLLEKMPAEKCWAITAKLLTGFMALRGSRTIAPELGKEEGIIAPVLGWEKWLEIANKTWAEAGKKYIPWVKQTFNIPVEDAIGAAKLHIVAATLLTGPEMKSELVEATRERAVIRWTQCGWWERYIELEQDPEFTVCHTGHQLWAGEGFPTINSKLTFKLKKSLPKGDPYCEGIIEFKEE